MPAETANLPAPQSSAGSAQGQVLQRRQAEFIFAARAIAVLRHLLPNLSGVLLVFLSLAIPGAIVVAASLSFLGLRSLSRALN